MTAKRLFDLTASGLGLLVLAPLLALITLLVRLDSEGPALFRQQRVGLHGEPFTILKFRTMYVGADKRGGSLTVGRDPRVTRVGRLLRHAKLDELPQLINVWRGDMSLVGPRPEVAKYVALYTPEQRTVLSVRPGITDLASIEFRSESDLLEGAGDPEALYVSEIMPRKLELNRLYLERQSLAYDVALIFRTLWRVVRPRRASGAATRPGRASSNQAE